MQLLGGLRRLARQRLTLPSKFVGHIYTKLDITSRVQLAAILTRIEYSNE